MDITTVEQAGDIDGKEILRRNSGEPNMSCKKSHYFPKRYDVRVLYKQYLVIQRSSKVQTGAYVSGKLLAMQKKGHNEQVELQPAVNDLDMHCYNCAQDEVCPDCLV